MLAAVAARWVRACSTSRLETSPAWTRQRAICRLSSWKASVSRAMASCSAVARAWIVASATCPVISRCRSASE
jgi:hypothetical protein